MSVGHSEVGQKRASRKLAGLVTTSRLLDPDFRPAKANTFRCSSRIKPHARKQIAKAWLTS